MSSIYIPSATSIMLTGLDYFDPSESRDWKREEEPEGNRSRKSVAFPFFVFLFFASDSALFKE